MFIQSIGALIYFIMLAILYLSFIKRSAELFILRIGFPLACLGLLDSDKGVFTTTVKALIQVALTTIVQLLCMMCSMVIFVKASNLLYAIAFCMAALGTPRVLQSILMQTGGGGGMYKVGSTLHVASLIRGFAGK